MNRQRDCWNKLQEFAAKNKGMMIRHKEFKDLLDNDDITICLLSKNFRMRTVNWRQFEAFANDACFDPDKL